MNKARDREISSVAGLELLSNTIWFYSTDTTPWKSTFCFSEHNYNKIQHGMQHIFLHRGSEPQQCRDSVQTNTELYTEKILRQFNVLSLSRGKTDQSFNV